MRTFSKLGLTRNVRLILSGGFVIGIVLLMNATFLIYVLRESAIRDRSQQVVNLATLLAQQASQSMLSTNTVLDRIVDVLQSEKIDTDEKFRDYGKKESTFKLLYERAQSTDRCCQSFGQHWQRPQLLAVLPCPHDQPQRS